MFHVRFQLAMGILAAALLLTGCKQAGVSGSGKEVAVASSPAPAAHQDIVQRGEYLVTVGGCNDCHTPMVMGPNGPQFDMTRMLSGHPQDLPLGPEMSIPAEAGVWAWAPHNTAWVTPAGVAYTFNLTPDENTGIGSWTEDTFAKTLRSGKHMGVARDILPPMPWFNYGKMNDEDMHAVWTYLRSIPGVQNRVPDAVVNQPPGVAAAH